MFNTLSEKALVTKLAITGFIAGAYGRVQDRREAGQGAVEYVGIIILVGIIVAGLIAWGPSLISTLTGKVEEAVDSL